MFYRRRNSARIDDLQRQIADDLRRIGRDRALVLLYAEVTTTRVQADIHRSCTADGRLFEPSRAGHDVIDLLLRELWSAFLIDGRPRWEGVTMLLTGSAGLAVWLTYPDLIDRSCGFEQRRDRAFGLARTQIGLG